MERSDFVYRRYLRQAVLWTLSVVAAGGCSQGPARVDYQAPAGEQRTFELKEIAPAEAVSLLSELGLGAAAVVPGRNALTVTGSPGDLYRAGILLALVDTREPFLIETLAPVAEARGVPANSQIAAALGGLAIGTFAHPPAAGERSRAIIDLHGDAVVAIIPARLHRELLAYVKLGAEGLRQARGEAGPAPMADTTSEESPAPTAPEQTAQATPEVLCAQVLPDPPEPNALPKPSEPLIPLPADIVEALPPAAPVTAEMESVSESSVAASPLDPCPEAGDILAEPVGKRAGVKKLYEVAPLANGEDVLHLNLPDRLELIQLLDLVAEYLGLDYLYEPEKMRGQPVSLRLHGKLQGEIRVKDLYPLLESVLKFKGFAMTCHKGNLVTIVPVADALQVDPTLLDPEEPSLGAGDMVVTRVFGLSYVSAASAMNLLESMKLSVAASPIAETGTLIVTCYAHRMARIERLLAMVDRPGRPRQFRWRQLKYTMADTLTQKVEALVAELQTVPVRIAPVAEPKSALPALTVSAPAGSSLRKPADSAGAEAAERDTVYLDADERTNRILMIGHAEQLAIVEEVVDALDVAQHDPRSLKVYAVIHLSAADARQKLEELEVLGQARPATAAPALFISKTSAPDKSGPAENPGPAVTEETQVTVLETTNALLINATDEQHARVAEVLRHVDVVQQDLRTFKVYDIEHVDAEEVKKQLAEFELIGTKNENAETPDHGTKPVVAASAAATPTNPGGPKEPATMQQPQVSVLDSKNALLVNATEFQHARMAAVISYVDTAARDEAIPYEIYFLESQDPEALAEILQKILHETVVDKEAKVEQVVRRSEEQIVIVPDKGTFSLVVYASRKNQEWISKLIKTLDKRRPQVLIDATLVEIRKNDEFTYDLDLVASIPDLTHTGGQTKQFFTDANTTVTEALRQAGRSQFVDFEIDSGRGVGFYADRHVQALLTAVQARNYGRILAKPKVLVNDNEKGTIKTTDTTYVVTRSSIPVTGGSAGSQNQLIETAVGYEPYEAGITLEITPHISEGDLLRLEVMLTRSDFTSLSEEKPPDLTSSNVGTVVTVPDGSTIILGGMLKLNQNKGGRKVPLLGDLPLLGGLFRSVDNSDLQSMLYIFVRAEIIRPAEALARGYEDLTRISDENREAFERYEQEFQTYQSWPGIEPKPVEPAKVLDAR